MVNMPLKPLIKVKAGYFWAATAVVSGWPNKKPQILFGAIFGMLQKLGFLFLGGVGNCKNEQVL